MTVMCKTPFDLLEALNKAAEAKIAKAIIGVQIEMATFCYGVWSSGKATWAREQPNDYWSGQYRASIDVAIGAPMVEFAPDNPGDWPLHPDPLPAMPVSDIEGYLVSSLTAPYQIVWISDNAPHALLVESRTGIAGNAAGQLQRMAATFTTSHFTTGGII